MGKPQRTRKAEVPGEWRPVKRRLIEVAVGLAIVLIAIALTRLWIGWKNVDRADSVALRECLALTQDVAMEYRLDETYGPAPAALLQRFLESPRRRRLPVQATHEFMDSFLVYYQDGTIDSLEAVALYLRLPEFLPAGE